MWFAFIFLSLSYWQQQLDDHQIRLCSCDLLSFSYLCRTDNNQIKKVVIFKELWFAFIFLSLSYWQQPDAKTHYDRYSCDLLSFSYLCRTDNNGLVNDETTHVVVICFHFPIFVVLTTTLRIVAAVHLQLWFAFIFLSLSYWQQLKTRIIPEEWSCDLLSFSYLCRTDNNCGRFRWPRTTVVICFHFPIFVVLTTTFSRLVYLTFTLWFAFIFLSLSYWQQPHFVGKV